jgi:hypothetical protein
MQPLRVPPHPFDDPSRSCYHEKMLCMMHYLYFLSQDEEEVEEAWERLSGSYSFESREMTMREMCEGPIACRHASAEGRSLSLFMVKNVTAIELLIHGQGEDAAGTFSEISERRRELDSLSPLGESTFLVQGDGHGIFPGQPLRTGLSRGELFIYPDEEEHHRRYYALVSHEDDAIDFIRERLIPLDCLLYQTPRQVRYYEDQRKACLKSKEETDKKVSEVLFRKNIKDLEALEQDVESLSGHYGLMANYSFVLSNGRTLLQDDLTQLENRLRDLLPAEDEFFFGRHVQPLRASTALLSSALGEFSLSLENMKSAIDIVKSRVELARSKAALGLQEQTRSLMKQNIVIQEEALTMGIAASLVEFFVVLYYGLQSWKTLATEEMFHHIPIGLATGLILAFSISVVAGTHKAAKAIKQKTLKGVFYWPVVMLFIVALMAAVSLYYSGGH